MRPTLVALFIAALCAPLYAAATDATSTSYQIRTPTLSSGVYATSTNFSLYGLLSPFVANGSQSATSFSSRSGFLAYPFVSTPILSASAGANQVALSWTGASGYLGWTPTSYEVGQSTASGGPYSFTSVGSALSSTRTGLTAGTPYYFVVRVHDAFGAAIATSSQTSATPTAPPPPPPPPPPSSPGGGGGGSVIPPTTTTGGASVKLSGRAYPGSTVTILKDAQVVSSINADSKALFQSTVGGISGGQYIFSVYGEDSAGNRSATLSFPVSVVAGASVDVTGIFLAPTIDVDKTQVKQGDNIAIFGSSVPNGNVTISVHSEENVFLTTTSDGTGAYLYNFDTTPLEEGDHVAKSKAAVSGEISPFGAAVGFVVGSQNVGKDKVIATRGDLNGNKRVDLIDFSIMVYWFKRTLTGAGVNSDLNKDGKVDLIDFSILAANWTG